MVFCGVDVAVGVGVSVGVGAGAGAGAGVVCCVVARPAFPNLIFHPPPIQQE